MGHGAQHGTPPVENTGALAGGKAHAPPSHEAHQIADFRRRFWVSLVLTIPILALSPMIQQWLGLGERFRFAGDGHVLFLLSSIVFFYGGYPFFKGIIAELKARNPGMMTLIALTIGVSYTYSTAVTFGLTGEVFSGNWLC